MEGLSELQLDSLGIALINVHLILFYKRISDIAHIGYNYSTYFSHSPRAQTNFIIFCSNTGLEYFFWSHRLVIFYNNMQCTIVITLARGFKGFNKSVL